MTVLETVIATVTKTETDTGTEIFYRNLNSSVTSISTLMLKVTDRNSNTDIDRDSDIESTQ